MTTPAAPAAHRRKALGLARLLGALLLAAAWGCGSGQPAPSPEALELKKHIMTQYKALAAPLASLAGQGRRAQMNLALRDYFRQAHEADQHLVAVATVLDAKSKVVASRCADPDEPAGALDPDVGSNYQGYAGLTQVLRNGTPTSGVLYGQDGKIYEVCGPLRHQGDIHGVLCLGLKEDALKRFNVDEDEFKRIDFAH